MKPSLLFIFLLFFLSVSAQRRAPTKPDTPEPEKPQSPPRGRGRARFSTTPEFTKISETQKDESAPARKRVNPVALERRTPPAIPSRTYAVQENVEDSPIESFRRQSKPRILTESRFEARNAPKKVVSEPASKPDTVDELFNSYGSNAADKTEAATAETTVKQEVTSEAESSTASTEAAKQENEIKRETTRSQSEVTTPKTAPKRRTNVIRSRVNPSQVPAESTTTGRSRVRTRATRRPDESSSTAAPLLRSSGRSSRRNGASLFVAEESQDAPSRSRTGRRINAREEVVPGDLITASTTRTRVVTNRKPLGSTTIKPTTGRRGSSRFASSLPSTTTVIPARDAVTPKKTLRSRTRVTPPVFDETKLEVLPLFEVEAKTVLPPGDILKPSASGSKSRYPSKPNDISSRVTVSHRVETRRQTYFRQKTTTRKPQIKETVVAQISEVTSRSSRKRNNEIPVDAKSRVTQPRISIGSVASRRKPASALNRSTLTKSEEEIDDSDNYPPQFKALLQAKKLKQESRPTAAATSSSSSEKEESINNPTTPTTSVTTEVPVARVISSTVASSTTGAVRAKEVLEADNEVVPKATPPSFRPTRRAKAKITTTLNAAKRQTTFGRSSKFSRSTTTTTTSPPIVSKGDHRFHSKYTTKTEYSESSTVQNDKSAYVKPSRGVYSSRKSKESFRQVKSAKIPSEPIIQSAQITRGNTLAKKSSRFSSKYRGDTSGRGSVLHTRSTTSAPAYIPTIPTAAYVPTIPTLNPPSTGKWRKGHLDKDLGLEVLTIDDPVFTVPSANLVNEDFVSSTSNSLVTSEKSVSIIESVINAIKAISTTASPDSTSLLTTAQSEPGSAIQKLAPKKLNDKTNDSTDNSVTTEKPTTIIERILSSINAIEADDTNSNKWNEVLNIQDLLNRNKQNDVTYRWKPVTRPYDKDQDSSTSTIAPFTSSQSTDTATETPSTLNPLSETIPPQTTTAAQTTESIKVTTTTFKNVVPAVTTALPSITTFFPQLFNTILSTLQPITTTYASPTTVRTQRGSTDQSLAATTVVPTTVSPYTSRGRIAFSDTITTDTPIVTTRKRITTTTEIPTTRRRITTTTEIPTTRRRITTTTEIPTFTTTTREPETTTMRFRTTTERQVRLYTTEPVTSTETTTKKLRELTEEQKMNLATLAQLEKEQADLLAQLSLLTGLPNGRKPAANNANLANRIIAMAMDRDRAKSTTASSVESSFGTTLQGGNKEPSLEEVLKQYNIKGVQQVAASPKPAVSSTYGTSNDALIASLLKEQGIGPTTPSSLNGVFTTTRRPRPQTRPPGRLMQGLNWLLDVLSPQPQPQPQPRPRPRATTRRPISEEILTNQPTHITPVVTRAPPKTRLGPNELSQEDIQKLISQLETLQKNPRDGKALDLSQIKSLNALINTNEGVRVTSSGEIGTTRPSRSQMTTFMPITTNHIEQEETYIPTSSYRPSTVSLPAVRLRPVPGVDDNNSDPLIRGNLISAAVNVTRAISSFLGSALQDAIHQLKQMHYGNPDISNLFQNITESQINSTIV
ncbi:unnamed protein product [Brassicogethes aeneus]|uniref:Uncharacterized protein n=1 Tax=Brassicogethes aeneus TaxID=1431903 RepID=A0A9P0BEB7_BRAAE|nr:unnamed protein product [Brassicogethes aeneus]